MDVFEEFLGKKVKVPYKEGGVTKIARGVLMAVDGDFLKISGELGVLIINKDTVKKCGLLKE